MSKYKVNEYVYRPNTKKVGKIIEVGWGRSQDNFLYTIQFNNNAYGRYYHPKMEREFVRISSSKVPEVCKILFDRN